MIASDSHRLLFVHVQKTGGLTIEALLRTALPDADKVAGVEDGRHARLGDALDVHPELADYWTFGFVRNPWARMYSWHAMILRRKKAAEAGRPKAVRRMRNMEFWKRVADDMSDFESFVLRGPDEFERLRTPQIDYLRAGGRTADFIGRTESLADDVHEVFALRGLGEPEVERRNAGPPTDYRAHYTPRMRDRVAEVFAADIERFDYSF